MYTPFLPLTVLILPNNSTTGWDPTSGIIPFLYVFLKLNLMWLYKGVGTPNLGKLIEKWLSLP